MRKRNVFQARKPRMAFSLILVVCMLLIMLPAQSMLAAPDDGIIHVNGAIGNDTTGDGSATNPYKTIQKAADLAEPGDTVLVAAGLYREHVKPARGGTDDDHRIVYKADGEVIIKGSEPIPREFQGKMLGWIPYNESGVWQVSVPNDFFRELGSGGYTNGTSNTVNDGNAILDYYNPFRQAHWNGSARGQWTAGDVYLNNYAYSQKMSLNDVVNNKRTWYFSYSAADQAITIYANFGGLNPNDSGKNLVEINTRRQNFASDEWGLSYITLDGFTMMHAGNWYSDFPDQPERAQRGAISVFGGKSWIIQNNRVINARSIGLDIGLGSDMWAGNGVRGVGANKPLCTTKTYFADQSDDYGHHLVQNNFFDRCGQCGIAGVFSWKSTIQYNQVENVNYRDEFSGAETAGIKLHYGNYGLIQNNYVRNVLTGNGGGIWTDWGNDGIRVTGNIVVNTRWPYYGEALFGPILVDNNVFIGSTESRALDGSGVIFANNILARYNGPSSFPANGDNSNGTGATGTVMSVTGSGRNCYWFTPGTMFPGLGHPTSGSDLDLRWNEVSMGSRQNFWWYNNLTQGNSIPNTSGNVVQNKKNTSTDAMTNLRYTANSAEMKLSFDLDTSLLEGYAPVTQESIGNIMYPNSTNNPTYTVGQPIPSNVLTDFFGNAVPAEDAKMAGPFADAKNGANEYVLWPREGHVLPKPLAIEAPDDGGVPDMRINLALFKTYSASSEEEVTDNPNKDPVRERDVYRAFDGGAHTRWASKAADGNDVWIEADLGSLYNIEEVKINWHTDYAKQYKLMVSETGEEGTWTDMFVQNDAGRTLTFDDGHCVETITDFINNASTDTSTYVRYIRLQGLERAGDAYSIWEFEVYGALSPYRPPSTGWLPEGRVNLAIPEVIPGDGHNPYSTAYASFARDPYRATNAIDGNTATRWSNDHGSTTDSDWIYVDLGDRFTIDTIVLRWEAAYGRSFRIEVSDDAGAGQPDIAGASNDRSNARWNENKDHAAAMTWTTVYSTTTGSGGNQTITLENPVDARCVRMYGVTPASQYGYSLWEFEIWGKTAVPTVTSVDAPFELDGNDISGTVSNQVTGVNLTNMIHVTEGATWALFSDSQFKIEVSKNVNPLAVGDTVRYIMITSADGSRENTYTITITRKSSDIIEFVSPPPLDGTLLPAEWGDKIFTLAAGMEGVSVTQFNSRPGYPPADFNADIYLGYDASNLYLGLIVTDSLWTPAKATSDLWQGCGIQLNLWSGRTGGRSEYGFGLTASGPFHYQWANGTGTTALPTGYSNYDIKRVEDTDTYIYTIAIPISSFRQNWAANPLVEGDELWFSIAYNYPNAAGSNMSYAFDLGFHSKNLNDARPLTLAGVEKSISVGKDPSAYTASTNNNNALNAFDGDLETKWESVGAGDQWIAADLGRRYSVSKVILDWGADYATAYKLQIAKKPGEWIDVYDSSNDAGRTANLTDGHWRELIDSKSFEGQYIRLLAANSAGDKYALWEFEVYGKTVAEDNGPQWDPGAKLSIGDYDGMSLTLVWPDPKDRLGVAGFKLYQNDELIATLGWNVLEYEVSDLVMGTKYSYTLVPFNSEGTEGAELKASTAMVNPDPKVAVSDAYPTQYSQWANSLVAGNGKQGIMVFGNPRNDTIVFNDKQFFMAREEGSPHRNFNQFDNDRLNAIRDNLIAGNWSAANPTSGTGGANYHQWSAGGEMTKHAGYRMFFDITGGKGTVRDYYRSTEYANGLVKVNWSDDDGDWERTSFVSRPDGVTVQYMDIPKNAPAGTTFNTTLALNYDRTEMSNMPAFIVSHNNTLEFLNIRVKYHGSRFDAGYEGVTMVITDGQKALTTDNKMTITGATYVELLSRTQRYNGQFDPTVPAFPRLANSAYKNTDLPKAEDEWAQEAIQAGLSALAGQYTYAQLLSRHTASHSEIFNRVSLDLNASGLDRAKTNEALLAEQRSTTTLLPALYERLFYVGRYTLMASGGAEAAPDLLGNWTGALANWDGSYHLDANLNLQISSGNIANMPEIMAGYFWLNRQWQKDFRTNASRFLNARGMLTGGNAPGPEGLISSLNASYPYQYVTGGESWLLYPFWEYYLITGDKEFLRDQYYPMIRDMGPFYEDFLINNVPEEKRKDSNGKYIFAGSISPETQPSGSGYRPLAINSVYDVSGAKFALETLIETCEILGTDLPTALDATGNPYEGWTENDIQVWQEILDNLPEYYTNRDGALPEYLWPTIDNAVSYDHRHNSSMMPVWPYREITKETNETIYNGAREFMRRKTGSTTGISGSSDYTRAGHGTLHGTLNCINLNMTENVKQNLLRLGRGTYYTGLASSHYATIGGGAPPFTDFCTDTVNAMPTLLMEMVATTDQGRLELLPAVSADFKKGSLKGMLGRSQFVLDDISWDMDKGEILLTLTSDIDQTLSMIMRDGIGSVQILSGTAVIRRSEYGNIARDVTLTAGNTVAMKITIGDADDLPDVSGLESAIADFKKLDQSDWAPRLWAAAQAACDVAEAVLDDFSAIQSDVDDAELALRNAMEALEAPRLIPDAGQAPSFVIRKNMITQIKVDTNLDALTFTSSNPAIATVTQAGVVTGKSIGVAVIQVKDTSTGLIFNFVINCTN